MRQTYQSTVIRRLGILTLFLTVALTVVYVLTSAIPALKAEKKINSKTELTDQSVEILRDVSILPPEVERIRQAMLSAAMSGNISAMRIPVEMNEIPPVISNQKVVNPIDYWRKKSGDGEGREILAIVIQLFRTGFSRKARGTGDEIYVWPYFAEIPLDSLTPAQEVELLTLVSPQRLNEMKAAGKYDHYRIGIAHDGTWHYFLDKDG